MNHLIKIALLWVFVLLLVSCGNQVKRIPVLAHDYTGFEIKTPQGDCQVASDGIDPVTFVRKTDLVPVKIFSYTHPRLKKYFLDSPLLSCEAAISRAGKNTYFLQLWFMLHASSTQVNYTGLTEDSALRIELIDGQQIVLTNLIQDDGQLNPDGKKVFTALYPLTKKDWKQLGKTEINKLGVNWAGGYEIYEVFDVDFMIRQIACFSKID